MKNQTKAYLFALLAVILWSTVATAFKIALRSLDYSELLFIANLTSLIVFGIVLISFNKLSLLRLSGTREIVLSAVQGLLNPFAYYLILFKAYSILPAQIAQPANFIWPVVLMLLSVPLLKQRLKLTAVIALIISFAGVFILATQGNPGSLKIAEPSGVALAVFTSVIWSLYWIINMRDKRDDLVKLFLSFSFSMLYILIFSLVTDNMPGLFTKASIPAVYVGIFEMGVTFIFWLKALQLSESTGKVAGLIYITPFLSLLCIHFILQEKLFYTSFIGLCLIIVGIAVGRIKSEAV